MHAEKSQNVGRLISGLADEPSLRWVAADLTGPVNQACNRLDLSPVAAGALGRVLTGAVLLQRMTIKRPSKLVLAVSGDGPLSRVMGEVDEQGDIRGMVSNPRIELPVGDREELGVGRALGSGLLQVWRDLPAGAYQSHVQLTAGGIGDALARFLEQSEQTRSAAVLGVLAESKGITAAGGLMLEVLPGSTESGLSRLETEIRELPGVSRLLADEGLDGLLDRVIGAERREVSAVELRYRCKCSAETMERYLSSLPPKQVQELENDSGEIEAECVFCGSTYRFAAGLEGP